MKVETVIFDLDGTLWDSAETAAIAWQEVVDQYGDGRTITGNAVRGLMGKTLEAFFEQFFDTPFKEEERESILAQQQERELLLATERGATLYPGLKETLQQLEKSYTLLLVSNCEDGYIENFLNYTGITLFKDFECAGRTQKPKDKNIELIIDRNGVKNCVYVGDTETDRVAAAKAGIPFIWASYGFGSLTEEADYTIREFKELPYLLEQL